jgi:hypothetical protein
MTSTLFTCALAATLSFTAVLPVMQAHFAGTWVLDTARSEGLPPGLEQTMRVKQSGDRLEIENELKGPQGEQRLSDVFVLDGKETAFKPPVIGDGSGTGKRTSRWSADKRGFDATERATLKGPEGEADFNVARKWTLAPDGSTLTIEMTMNGPQGEMKSRRVFTRQK